MKNFFYATGICAIVALFSSCASAKAELNHQFPHGAAVEIIDSAAAKNFLRLFKQPFAKKKYCSSKLDAQGQEEMVICRVLLHGPKRQMKRFKHITQYLLDYTIASAEYAKKHNVPEHHFSFSVRQRFECGSASGLDSKTMHNTIVYDAWGTVLSNQETEHYYDPPSGNGVCKHIPPNLTKKAGSGLMDYDNILIMEKLLSMIYDRFAGVEV